MFLFTDEIMRLFGDANLFQSNKIRRPIESKLGVGKFQYLKCGKTIESLESFKPHRDTCYGKLEGR